MPNKPKIYCSICRTSHDGPCPKKPRWGWNRKRVKRSGRGGDKWTKLREFIFRRDGYLCQIHKAVGKIRTVELHGHNHGVLDHKIALSDWHKDLGNSESEINLWTICQECDKAKTEAERNGKATMVVAGSTFDLLDMKLHVVEQMRSHKIDCTF